MIEDIIAPDLMDKTKEDNIKLSNLLDPMRWGKLIKDSQNTEDKRTLQEMIEELIQGR